MSQAFESDNKAKALHIAYYKRHILFCAGPKCCKADKGDELWHHLKSRLKDLGLAVPGSGAVFRTKAHCLRVCADGPIAVVYPEGTWYRFIDRRSLDRIIDEHLMRGQVVKDLIFSQNHEIGRSQ